MVFQIGLRLQVGGQLLLGRQHPKQRELWFDREHHQIGGGFLVERQCPFDVAFQVGLRLQVGGQLHHLGGHFEVGRDS